MQKRPLVLAVLLCVACVDEAPMPDVTDLPPLEAGTVRVNIRVEEGSGDTRLIELTLDAKALDIGAYQGRMVFDPHQMELLEVNTPDDNLRLVNTNNALIGEIRFAGVAATTFDSPVILELRITAGASFDPNDMHAELDVVGDLLGTQVGRQDIAPPTLMIVR